MPAIAREEFSVPTFATPVYLEPMEPCLCMTLEDSESSKPEGKWLSGVSSSSHTWCASAFTVHATWVSATAVGCVLHPNKVEKILELVSEPIGRTTALWLFWGSRTGNSWLYTQSWVFESTSLHLPWNLKYGGQGHSFVFGAYKNVKCVLDSAWCVAFSSLTTLQTLRVLVSLQIPQVLPAMKVLSSFCSLLSCQQLWALKCRSLGSLGRTGLEIRRILLYSGETHGCPPFHVDLPPARTVSFRKLNKVYATF